VTDQNPPCSAGLMLAGRHYHCDLATDAHGRHDGWRHSAYVRVQAERDELRAKIAQIEVLAHLFETVPSQRLIDALTSDIRDVPNGHAQPELE
jgi:hypothetical protein